MLCALKWFDCFVFRHFIEERLTFSICIIFRRCHIFHSWNMLIDHWLNLLAFVFILTNDFGKFSHFIKWMVNRPNHGFCISRSWKTNKWGYIKNNIIEKFNVGPVDGIGTERKESLGIRGLLHCEFAEILFYKLFYNIGQGLVPPSCCFLHRTTREFKFDFQYRYRRFHFRFNFGTGNLKR